MSSRDFNRLIAGYQQFSRVVLTENINDEIPMLYDRVGIELSNGELIRRKATGKDYIKYLSLDEKLKRRLEKDNALDHRLYEHFKRQSNL